MRCIASLWYSFNHLRTTIDVEARLGTEVNFLTAGVFFLLSSWHLACTEYGHSYQAVLEALSFPSSGTPIIHLPVDY